MAWLTRARVIPSLGGIFAWSRTLPPSNCRRHSWAFRRNSTTRGDRVSRRALNDRRALTAAFTTWPAVTRAIRIGRPAAVVNLPTIYLMEPLGLQTISTPQFLYIVLLESDTQY